MIKLEQLREVSDQVLSGLTADDSLKYRIIQNATSSKKSHSGMAFRPVPVLCCVVALVLASACLLNSLRPVSPAGDSEIRVFAAGSTDSVHTEDKLSDRTILLILKDITPDSIASIELIGTGVVTEPSDCASLLAALQDYAGTVDSVSSDERYDTVDKESIIITMDDGTVYKIADNHPEFDTLLKNMLSR